jgi:secreted PhoX family phosphatase
MTGTDEVIAVDLSARNRPFAYQYVGATEAENAVAGEFDSPDNLALDRQGNLAITEDPGGVPPAKTMGDDIWIAEPQGGTRQPAGEVARFASIKDCIAEPTGVYFALEGTSAFTEGTPREALVTDESLFVNRQHAGQGTVFDQFVSIAPAEVAE